MIPPRAVWEAVQEVRCVRDKSYLRWMPHVNLLYPFLEDDPSGETFADAAAIAADALKETAPFRCSLSAFAFFQHARSATVWLHPAECAGVDEEWARLNTGSASNDARDGDENEDEPCDVASNSNALEPGPPACPPASRGLLAAQRNLEAAFPFADHLSTISKAGFVPHVSVGQWPDAVSASAAVANLHASWRPLEFDVDAVFLISRPSDGSGPFQV
jgi:poly(A) polymerase